MDKKQAYRSKIINIPTTMRNLFVIFGLVIALSISAQTKLTKGGAFKGLNKQGDTLTASNTVNYTLELGNDVYGILYLAVESDSVSGTPAYSAYLYESLNGEDWGVAIDTITHTGGASNYGVFDLLNAVQTHYLISTVASSAAQKSKLKIFGRLNEGFVIQQ